MNNKDFRKHAHEFIDWIADYFEDIKEYPVMTNVQPGDTKKQLSLIPPDNSEEMKNIFQDFIDIIMPGITHWQHPSFFAYFPANTSFPSLLAEFLTAALGVLTMSWQTSPSGTELEEVVMEWLKRMLDLPDEFTGVIQDTASTATLTAFICARERSTNFGVNESGFSKGTDPALTVYTSEESHSSIEKGAKMAGFGKENIRFVPTDDKFSMIPAELERLIQKDVSDGYKPCCVIAATGTTSSLALDPLRPIGQICQKHGIWFHVDAAMAGTAAILPEMRYMLDGVELADSFVFNPHKWMLTNFDCSAYFVKDVSSLVRVFEIHPEYLKTDADTQVKNYRDWGIPLGRRFRALKLWFVIRSYGVEGIRKVIRGHIKMAEDFGKFIEANPDFELLTPVSLNLACFRFNPNGKDLSEEKLEEINKNLMDRLNHSGKLFLTHTKLKGKFTLRFCIGKWNTTSEHVERAWEDIKSTSKAILVD